MPALSYKSFLVPRVVDGTKPHSIRAWRKVRPFRVGDRISHFTGSRFKPQRIRPDTFCTSAASITIDGSLRHVILSDYSPRYGFGQLSMEKVRELALADGFADVSEFFNFFELHHDGKLLGQLIEWNPFAPVPVPALENGEPAAVRGNAHRAVRCVTGRSAPVKQSPGAGRRKAPAAVAASPAVK